MQSFFNTLITGNMAEPPDGSVRRIGLSKQVSALQLWAIAVGLVISGEYFGWNYGWQTSGTLGFLGSVLLVTILYVCFIFSYTELTAAIPQAGGPFSYAQKAFGDVAGFATGVASLIDFVLGPPAIGYALGSYVHFLNPALPVIPVAAGSYMVFIGINLLGIKESARFSLVITILSVVELLVFIGVLVPYFSIDNFVANNPANVGVTHVFAGIPFAIWFFLAIEGVAMVAEEVKTPRKTIPKAYIGSIITLVVLAFGVMLVTGGVGNWASLARIDHPMPEALSMALGQGSYLSKAFASLGLFGLIASFHCNTISYSRQIYAMAREGFLPRFLAEINPRFQTPHWALIIGGLIGLIAIFSGTTDQIIILSVLGALVMYVASMLSLFVLRQKAPMLDRPYRTPLYPLLPSIALVLSVVCLLSIVYYYVLISTIFLVVLGSAVGVFWAVGLRYTPPIPDGEKY